MKNGSIEVLNKIPSAWKWIFFCLLLLFLSYIRETTFLVINSVMAGEANNYANTAPPNWIKQLNLKELTQLKYTLTASFIIVFFTCTYFALNITFKTNFISAASKFIYIASIGLLVVIFGADQFITKPLYSFQRMIVGVLHSPLIFLFLSIVSLAKEREF